MKPQWMNRKNSMAMYPNGFCIKFDAPEGEDRQISFVNYLVCTLTTSTAHSPALL